MNHPAHGTIGPPDIEGVDPSSARVFAAFMRTANLHRQLMLHVFSEQGTPPGQAMCLRIVASHDGATQREIGEMLQLSAPTVTSMLKRMERHGLIAREADPGDQRVARVHLTPVGRARNRELGGTLADFLARVLDSIPEADRHELARLLDSLAAHIAVRLAERPSTTTTGGSSR